MTAKRGTLWKTSWRRQKPSVAAAPVPMWFFRKDNDPLSTFYFEQPLLTPAIGDGLPPFWIGAIFGTDVDDTPVLSPAGSLLYSGGAWKSELQLYSPSAGLPAELRALASDGGVNLEQNGIPSLSPPLNPIALRAVVQLITVEKVGVGDLLLSLWIDGALRQQQLRTAVYAPGAAVTIDINTGYVSSMAGGNGLPTTQEIQDWFQASRYASPFPAAQAIAGKTLDIYDAAATPGVVPDPLVNLSTGQDAVLFPGVSPAVTNVLLDATFAY